MNKRINEIYIAIHNDEIVFAETNLAAFFRGIKSIEPSIPDLKTLRKRFKNTNTDFFVSEYGRKYHFYKYENPK